MVKKLKLSILFLLVLLFCEKAFGRDIGCQVSTNQVYRTKVPPGLLNIILGSKAVFKDLTFVQQQCVSQAPGDCVVCSGELSYNFLGILSGCQGGWMNGTQVNYMMNCNLDSNNIILLLLGGSSGLWFIYRKPK